jgi:two-component system sensor histidine kinase DegS
MNKEELCRLDNIIQNISMSISNGIEEIAEMANSSKKDFQELECEFRRLKNDATDSIMKVKAIEERLKNYLEQIKDNTTDNLNSKEIEDLRLQLAIEKNREKYYVSRRNEIENHLKIIRKVASKSEKIEHDFILAKHLLTGNIKDICDKIDNIHSQELLGIKILEAQENERQRIARDMHDGPAQSLTNLIHKSELCIKLIEKDPIRTSLELQSLKNVVRGTIDDTRRIIYNLRPMSIDDLGLIPTLERYIEDIQDDVNYNIRLIHNNDEYEVKPIINLTLFRIVQEAFNNIDKYAQATEVEIQIDYIDDFIELFITDNGIGFDINEIKLNKSKKNGFGLSMMKERVHLLSGCIDIKSEINIGTSCYIKVPVNQ